MDKYLYSLDFHHPDHSVSLWHERCRLDRVKSQVCAKGSFDHKVPVLPRREWYRLGDRVKTESVFTPRNRKVPHCANFSD
jgi:hypothetical protein